MFTPIQTFVGGVLLHISTSTLLTDTGRIFGISGIFDGALFGASDPKGSTVGWRWSALTGLVAGPFLLNFFRKSFEGLPDPGSQVWGHLSFGRLALAGLLVGIGSRLGSGCTSGHFLCGVSRLSPRSLTATAVFFSSAVLTANFFPFTYPPSTPLPAYKLSNPTEILPFIMLGLAATIAQPIVRRIIIQLSRSSSNPSRRPSHPLRLIPYFVAGLTFSLGLCVSGMVSPLKVVSFLRMSPPFTHFDPSLAVIVISGVLPNAIHYALKRQQLSKPTYEWEVCRIPQSKEITWRLVLGSVLFGVGWGLGGVCPGPAIVSMSQLFVLLGKSSLTSEVLGMMRGWTTFAVSMVIGTAIGRNI